MEQSYSTSLCMFIQMLNLILTTGLTPRLVIIVLRQPLFFLPQVSRLLWNQNDCCSSLSIREQLLEASWVKGSQELLRIHMGCHRNKSLQQSWVAPVSPSSCPTPSPAPLLPAFYLLHHYLACSSRPIGNQLWLYSAAATCRNVQNGHWLCAVRPVNIHFATGEVSSTVTMCFTQKPSPWEYWTLKLC